MTNASTVKIIDKILSNKKKFKRAILILLIIAAVSCYGFYSGEISKIVGAIFNSASPAGAHGE